MKNLHIKMTHTGNKPALLDNSDQALSEGFDDAVKALHQWANDIYLIYVEKFGNNKLTLDELKSDCLDILREQYNNSIRKFKVDIKNQVLGSVIELDIGKPYSIFLHANKTTLKEFK